MKYQGGGVSTKKMAYKKTKKTKSKAAKLTSAQVKKLMKRNQVSGGFILPLLSALSTGATVFNAFRNSFAKKKQLAEEKKFHDAMQKIAQQKGVVPSSLQPVAGKGVGKRRKSKKRSKN